MFPRPSSIPPAMALVLMVLVLLVTDVVGFASDFSNKGSIRAERSRSRGDRMHRKCDDRCDRNALGEDGVNESATPDKTTHHDVVNNRRNFMINGMGGISATSMLLPSILVGLRPSAAKAEDEAAAAADAPGAYRQLAQQVFVSGTVTIPNAETSAAVQALSASSMPALYVTCRPDRPDNVPSAILSGTRGKPPPVLAAKFINPPFPFQFQLTGNDLTLEGITSSQQSAREMDPDKFWWRNENFIVSARWDDDGIAATRSPNDLVGKGAYAAKDPAAFADIQLTGRGAFGKFATKKS
uniref:Uncharacterized protein n=1 Tax=Craspedostauros australis TaxID=1486917 RepID=A0A7R9WUG4_9STRA|mmetsp:Transcript_21491/g.59805  ORF Transcript_21491/g.59805 Transcript_21491/m.59805 type:complete len:297 (+) Transcript_21491:808-1698(+)